MTIECGGHYIMFPTINHTVRQHRADTIRGPVRCINSCVQLDAIYRNDNRIAPRKRIGASVAAAKFTTPQPIGREFTMSPFGRRDLDMPQTPTNGDPEYIWALSERIWIRGL
jgi:hypothetical protein